MHLGFKYKNVSVIVEENFAFSYQIKFLIVPPCSCLLAVVPVRKKYL